MIYQKQKAMTLQDLKENREQILKIISNYTTRTKEAMEVIADEDSLKYSLTDDTLTYANDTLSRYFGKQKVGLAEMMSEANDHKTFDHITKKYK